MKRTMLVARRSRWRWLLIPAMLATTAAHLPVISPHLQQAPYMGVLFILLSTGCLLLASAMISWDPLVLYFASALVCGSAVLGYAATRLVEFPMLADDVGDWLEPLGVLSVAAETLALAVAIAAVYSSQRIRTEPSRPERVTASTGQATAA